MPSRNTKKATVGGWVSNQLWNTSLPWLLGLFFVGTGFYYTTYSTLIIHTEDLKELKLALKSADTRNQTDREKVRDQFLVESKATAAGIAELNKTTAVMGATMLEVQKSVDRLGQKLEGLRAK